MKKRILLAAAVLVTGVLSYAFMGKQTPKANCELQITDDVKGYEYMSIIQTHSSIATSGTSQEYKGEKTKYHSWGDFTLSLKRVQELESQGWELIESNVSTEGTQNYFLLRKKKE